MNHEQLNLLHHGIAKMAREHGVSHAKALNSLVDQAITVYGATGTTFVLADRGAGRAELGRFSSGPPDKEARLCRKLSPLS